MCLLSGKGKELGEGGWGRSGGGGGKETVQK